MNSIISLDYCCFCSSEVVILLKKLVNPYLKLLVDINTFITEKKLVSLCFGKLQNSYCCISVSLSLYLAIVDSFKDSRKLLVGFAIGKNGFPNFDGLKDSEVPYLNLEKLSIIVFFSPHLIGFYASYKMVISL